MKKALGLLLSLIFSILIFNNFTNNFSKFENESIFNLPQEKNYVLRKVIESKEISLQTLQNKIKKSNEIIFLEKIYRTSLPIISHFKFFVGSILLPCCLRFQIFSLLPFLTFFLLLGCGITKGVLEFFRPLELELSNAIQEKIRLAKEKEQTEKFFNYWIDIFSPYKRIPVKLYKKYLLELRNLSCN